MLNPDQWSTILRLVGWLDRENGLAPHEIAMRIMKVTEEAGEVASAYAGWRGQNPRKGTTHNRADVEAELCDVILAAAVALASLNANPDEVLAAKLAKVADRAGSH